MRTSEKQELKRKLKQLGLFFVIVFLPVLVVAVCMVALNVPQWLNILVLVVVMFIMFAVFSYVMNKLNQKKLERLSKKKDPFSD